MKETNKPLYIALLTAGTLLFCIGGFVLNAPELKTVSGICIGVGAGLFGLSVSQLTVCIIEERNPESFRQAAIEASDERNITINNRAAAKAFRTSSPVLGILMLTYVMTSESLATILLLVAAYLVIWGVYLGHLVKYRQEM